MWVASEICLESSVKKRAKIISHFIIVAVVRLLSLPLSSPGKDNSFGLEITLIW